jgi:hypothetical protein
MIVFVGFRCIENEDVLGCSPLNEFDITQMMRTDSRYVD